MVQFVAAPPMLVGKSVRIATPFVYTNVAPSYEITGGVGTTVIEVKPLFPSLVAVTLVTPSPRAATEPLLSTVATEPSPVVHVTVRPVSALPLASVSSAVACVVCPTWTLEFASVTVTNETGTRRAVTMADPVCPSLVAVTLAAPTPTPVTRPLLFTDATEPLLVVQAMVRPASVLPLTSFNNADACVVCPT
jgi:hypothetical protein